MNTFNILISVAFVVCSQLISCHAVNDCEDVTVGGCTVDPFDVIQTVDIFTDVRDCQFYCNALTNCALFRFNGTECTLLTKDYRKDCQVVAGPFDKQIDKCFEIDDKQTCDLFLQENCDYTGTVILEPPIGTIADPKECEQLCFQFNAIGCTYWVFDQTLKKCSLRGANSKACSTWAGPKSPTFDECQATPSSTVGPTTVPTVPTVPTTVPVPTTSKVVTTARPTTMVPTTMAPTTNAPVPTTTKK